MKKLGYFFLSFLPLLISMGLQILLTFPILFIFAIKLVFPQIRSGNTLDLKTLVSQLSTLIMDPDFTAVVSVTFAIFSILIYTIWYSKQFHVNLKQPLQEYASFSRLLGIVLLVPGLQLLSALLTGITSSFFPSWLESYQKLLESAGFGVNPSALLILYAVFLGPVSEEFTFRGVVFSSAKKVLPFWGANVLQALLFGIFHLNIIQGIYAFFIGLFLGYICEKGGSIYLSIFLHILFNAWGTLLPADNPLLATPMSSLLFFVGATVLGVIGIRLFQRDSGL